jgi:hypothetical protein
MNVAVDHGCIVAFHVPYTLQLKIDKYLINDSFLDIVAVSISSALVRL